MTNLIIERHFNNIKRRKEYYLKNRESIIKKNAEYQKVTYHRNKFNLFLNWFLDETAFFTKKDYKYIEKMNYGSKEM